MVTPGQLKSRAQLFDQLAGMITAGVPLIQALELAGENRSVNTPKKVIQALVHYLKEGYTFTDAMQLLSGQKEIAKGEGIEISLTGKKSYWLTDFDIALLSAGEESGRLDNVFRVLARYYESRARIISDTISHNFTTAATVHVFLLIFPLAYLTAFVLGLLDNDYSRCLPFLYNKAFKFGILYGIGYLLAVSVQGGRGEFWRGLVESIFSVVPVLRNAVKYLALARLACALEALTNAGVPVSRSWKLAASACGSPRLKRDILASLPQLESGMTPAEMVQQISYFPEMFSNQYNTAELSGRQDETLAHLHKFYEEEGFNNLKFFMRLLSGTIYAVVVIIVAINIIQFYTGYFNNIFNSV